MSSRLFFAPLQFRGRGENMAENRFKKICEKQGIDLGICENCGLFSLCGVVPQKICSDCDGSIGEKEIHIVAISYLN